MKNYLLEILKKTRLRKPVGSDFKYYRSESPWSSQKSVEAISAASFNNQNFSNNLPGQSTNNVPPTVTIDYMVLENEDFLIGENNDNIII